MHHTRNRTVSGALVFFALLAVGLAPAAASSPPSAFVRVEGAGATLMPQTLLRTTSATKIKGNACPGTSAAGALDTATDGNWSGSYSAKFRDYLVGTILGESPAGNNFWTLWVNGRSSSTGACSTPLHPGDHVLWFDCQADANFNCTNNPLTLGVPALARRGRPIIAHVAKLDGNGHTIALGGVAVSGDGVAGVSAPNGAVRFVPRHAGTIALQATKSGATPSDPVFLCVYARARSECGSAAAPPVHVNGITEGKEFARNRAPRELTGTAGPDASGLTDVSLSLSRVAPNGHCAVYDGTRAAFRASSCRAIPLLFSIGASASWSYLLPKALPAGHYRLEVLATDGAGRRTKLVVGSSVIGFSVR